MILNINFGHIPSFGSRDNIGKRNFGKNLTFRSAVVTLNKIRSRSSKPHQLFALSKQFTCESSVKINTQVQEMEWRPKMSHANFGKLNQRTNGPVNAHLISGTCIRTQHTNLK